MLYIFYYEYSNCQYIHVGTGLRQFVVTVMIILIMIMIPILLLFIISIVIIILVMILMMIIIMLVFLRWLQSAGPMKPIEMSARRASVHRGMYIDININK